MCVCGGFHALSSPFVLSINSSDLTDGTGCGFECYFYFIFLYFNNFLKEKYAEMYFSITDMG